MASISQKLKYLHPAGKSLRDWVVINDGKPGSRDVIDYWNAGLGPQPTQAELDALTDQEVMGGLETQVAQQEKAAATQEVDAAFTKAGNRVGRAAYVGVAISMSNAENATRKALSDFANAFLTSSTFPEAKGKIALITFPGQVTQPQVINAIKAAIAATPE